jgi:UDP-N-acetylmuramyl tripeptide synthase
MALPGAFNRSNALVAVAAASALGVTAATAAQAVSTVEEVAGRFDEVAIDGTRARLMLAKNPAGWAALLDLVATQTAPVVVAINSRVADGADPSWLYDVDFSGLAGREVVATGERWRDLSVRLAYAGVPHRSDPAPSAAVVLAGARGSTVEVIGNYTAFRDLLEGAR